MTIEIAEGNDESARASRAVGRRERMARPSLTNVYLVVGAASIFPVFYALVGKEPTIGVRLFGLLAPGMAVVLWLQRYLRQQSLTQLQDAAWLLFLGWPMLIPFYAVRLEGRRGWLLAALLVALMFTPQILAALVGAFRGP